MKRLAFLALTLGAFIAAGIWLQSPTDRTEAAGHDHEVWVTVQGTHQIKVFLPDGTGGLNLELTIDYTDEDLEVAGEPYTGPDLRNPHMILFGLHGEPGSRFGYVSNVSSPARGTTIIDAQKREIVAVLDTGVRTHAVQPSPDGTRALAFGLGPAGGGCADPPDCGNIREILTDTSNPENPTFTDGRDFRWTDFADQVPQGALPRFDPVCGSFTPDSRFVYVTLFSGGLVIFEINEDGDDLFKVVRVFPAGTGPGQFAQHGCGLGYSTDGRLMFANAGAPSSGTAPEHGDFYYVFRIATHSLIHQRNLSGIVSDVHGMMLSPTGNEVIMAGRESNNFILINQKSGALKLGNTFSSSPLAEAPDLTDYSPDGRWVYGSHRGPCPSTGSHDNAGNTPGVSVLDMQARQIVSLEPIATGGDHDCGMPGDLNPDRELSDPHGLAVRRLAPAPTGPLGASVALSPDGPPFGPPAGRPR